MNTSVTLRFAPSPTGHLHVGNARVALINWLYARSQGGRFILRYDDTDVERSKPEFAEAIARDLSWLGITWDMQARQSDRLDSYHRAAESLKQSGRLYPCYETPEELDTRRKLQMARHKPPVYDRAALKLSLDDEGRRPHWRFLLDHEDVRWPDLVRGDSHAQASSLSDPVLIRADGTFLYTLPSVVDDIDMKVSHVVRGEDHVTNTAPQLQLFKALGAEPPIFAHLALLTGADGEGLSKRLGSASLGDLREDGIEPLALTSLLARMGTSHSVELAASMDELAQEFSFERISRASPRFDPRELDHLNARLLHNLDWAQVSQRFEALQITGADAAFWQAIKGNLARFSQSLEWWQVITGPCTPIIEDPTFMAQALALLPPEPWDVDTWGQWTALVKEATGTKGKGLFHPLRMALTGRENGPELKNLLPLMGRTKAIARLSGMAE
jgi:glutamyl-tRNA synthetase